MIKTPRARTFPAIQKLREEVQHFVHEQFSVRPRLSAAQICDETLAHFDSIIAPETLRRYRNWWDANERPLVMAMESATEMMAAMEGKDGEAVRAMITQLLAANALNAAKDLEGADPADVMGLHILNQRVENDRAKIELQGRKLALQEAANKVDEAGKAEGLNAETIEKFKNAILGVAA